MVLQPDQRPASTCVDRVCVDGDYSFARVINGCWQLAAGHGGNSLTETALFSRFSAQVEAGFTTFDCADIYTGVEELLGRFIRSCPAREAIQVHTKFVPDLAALAQLDRRQVEAGIHRSLTRLGVDRLDLVQFHWWDYAVPGYLDALEVLVSLQQQGKIRHLGLTNFNREHLLKILESGFPIASLQLQFSLLDRRPQNGISSLCQQYGVRMLAYGVLAGGLLSRAYLDSAQPGAENRSLVKYGLIIEEAGGWEKFQQLLELLSEIAQSHGRTIASVAARWVLDQPDVAAVILGTGSRDRIEENRSMLKMQLSQSEKDLLNAMLGKMISLPGDVFDLERHAGGRHASIMKTGLNAAVKAES